jgi:hypothetical protein
MPVIRHGIILSSCLVLVFKKTSIMQDNRRDNPEEEFQENKKDTAESNQGNETQQAMTQRPVQDKGGAGDISERDQQEGNMNNGTLGGNFGEDNGG